MRNLSTRSRLSDADGVFSMVAVDQRESLRTMLGSSTDEAVTDEDLSVFKVDVARTLSPYATGLLIDLDYGLDPVLESGALDPSCPVIAAIDEIGYTPQGVAQTTAVRHDLLSRQWSEAVAGLKLLLLWTPTGWIGCSHGDVREYVAASRDAGLESVLEVVVRDADGSSPSMERHGALLVDAARELSAYGPSLYKTEVPFHAKAPSASVVETSRHITDALDCPWVVLSSGVAAEEFAGAVIDTRRGGARGFLAGRAIWGAAARGAAADRSRRLEQDAVGVLQHLTSAARTIPAVS